MREKEFLPAVREKLGIDTLNEMQTRMMGLASEKRDIMLLAPTGSGKTLAFALPMLKMLNPPSGRVQGVIIAPTRELALQIAGVIRPIAPGYRLVTLYGGHSAEDEINSLKVTPDLIVATPGRLLDHIGRRSVVLLPARILVLDEFDKILELGFERDLRKIRDRLKNVSRTILTSATRADILPDFLKLNDPVELDWIGGNRAAHPRLTVHRVEARGRDKLNDLLELLRSIAQDAATPPRTIIFVNHRESAERVATFLHKAGVDCVLYHGALDQQQRETALSLFNHGSRPILVATDLAARGLDIDGVEAVVHYHQPLTPEAWTHRNGRTARFGGHGDIYLLLGPDEQMHEFVDADRDFYPDPEAHGSLRSGLATLRVNAGKREKISRGDILGFLTKVCGLPAPAVGKIDIYDHYSLFTIPAQDSRTVIQLAAEMKIKGARRKVTPAR